MTKWPVKKTIHRTTQKTRRTTRRNIHLDKKTIFVLDFYFFILVFIYNFCEILPGPEDARNLLTTTRNFND